MNRMTKKDFAFNHGWFCPFCYDPNISYVDGSLTRLQETHTCLECNATWVEHHKVSHYTIINKPQEEPYVKDE